MDIRYVSDADTLSHIFFHFSPKPVRWISGSHRDHLHGRLALMLLKTSRQPVRHLKMPRRAPSFQQPMEQPHHFPVNNGML
jgi:hypothetical protein